MCYHQKSMETAATARVDLLIVITTWVCFAAMVVWSAIIVFHLFFCKRKKRIDYLRSYARGKFTFAFVPFFFLYFVGLYFGRKEGMNSFDFMLPFEALKKTIEMISLRYDDVNNLLLTKAYRFYCIAIRYSYILITVNALLFAWAVLQQRVSYWCNDFIRKSNRWCCVPTFRKNKCYIYGNNDKSRIMYKTAKEEGYRQRFIVDTFPIAGDTSLFSDKYRYSSCNDKRFKHEALYAKKVLRDRLLSKWEWFSKHFSDKRHLLMIINFADDNRNIELCRVLIDEIEKYFEKYKEQFDRCSKTEQKTFKCSLNRINIIVFGDENLSSVYQEIENASHGCIRYTNKYRLISTDFVINHPFTAYMNENHIDYQKAVLKPNVNVSVVMIGFGKTNRRIFTDLIADNQFVQKTEKGYKTFQAKYFLYDCKNDIYTKDLNHDFFRYSRFLAQNPTAAEYLPLPVEPAIVRTCEGNDINSLGFYKSIRESLVGEDKKTDSSDLSYIIIAFGSDLENIEFAKKIRRKVIEWQIPNCHIFVKVDKGSDHLEFLKKNSDFIKPFVTDKKPNDTKGEESNNSIEENSDNTEDENAIILFGDEGKIYSVKNVALKGYFNLVAFYNNRKRLSVENGYDPKFFGDEWYSKYPYDRASSFAREMNLKNKLGMVNRSFEIRDEKADETESNQFLEEIMRNDDVKEAWNRMEHLRWNAFMICNGYIPSTRKQIGKFNPDDEDEKAERKRIEHMERHHCNLTTHEGLEIYEEMFAEYCSKEGNSVIEYDDVPFIKLPDVINASGGRIVLVKKPDLSCKAEKRREKEQ